MIISKVNNAKEELFSSCSVLTLRDGTAKPQRTHQLKQSVSNRINEWPSVTFYLREWGSKGGVQESQIHRMPKQVVCACVCVYVRAQVCMSMHVHTCVCFKPSENVKDPQEPQKSAVALAAELMSFLVPSWSSSAPSFQ